MLKATKSRLFKLCNNSFPIINIGSGEIYSISKLANIIKAKVKYKGKIFFNTKYPNGVMKKNIDSSRIQKLNWKPKFDLHKGLNIVLNEFNI